MLGDKSNKYYLQLGEYLPDSIENWTEPFSGTFGLKRLFSDRIKYSIYNDLDTNLYTEWSKHADESYQLDALEFIEKFNDIKYFHFIDPPYYGKEFYYNINFDKHIELYNKLKLSKFNFLLSYNDCDYIRDLYKDFKSFKLKTDFYKNEIFFIKN